MPGLLPGAAGAAGSRRVTAHTDELTPETELPGALFLRWSPPWCGAPSVGVLVRHCQLGKLILYDECVQYSIVLSVKGSCQSESSRSHFDSEAICLIFERLRLA